MTTPSTSAQGPVALDAVIAAIEDQMPATQDMESTMICEALERAIVAVRALPASPSPAASPASPSGDAIPIKLAHGKGGWTIDPETLEAIADKVNADGWDCGQWEGIQGVLLAVGVASPASDATPAPTSGSEDGVEPFQQRVQPWMMACFGADISADVVERNHRFLEEALELVQSTGCTASEAHQLVDYVFGREVGETHQEIGGVMVTLAALCLALGEDMHAAGETELARIWTKVEKIRAKQAAKPKHSPLPQALAKPASELPTSSESPAGGVLDAKTLRGIIARWETRREYLNTNPSAYDAFIEREVAGIPERALSSSAGPAVEMRDGIYIASKTTHGASWRALRASGAPIISTWIDEAEAGANSNWPDLWHRCVREASQAAVTIVYREEGEVLKGAFVEMGAALATGRIVFTVGCDEFSVRHHMRVVPCASLEEALDRARAALAPAAEGRKG